MGYGIEPFLTQTLNFIAVMDNVAEASELTGTSKLFFGLSNSADHTVTETAAGIDFDNGTAHAVASLKSFSTRASCSSGVISELSIRIASEAHLRGLSFRVVSIWSRLTIFARTSS